MNTRPCAADPKLWDSTDIGDHLRARAICDTCPAGQVARCQQALADTQHDHPSGPQGTWGGLYVNGDRAIRITEQLPATPPRRQTRPKPTTPVVVAPVICSDCGITMPRRTGSGRQAKYCDPCKRERRRATVRRWNQKQNKELNATR